MKAWGHLPSEIWGFTIFGGPCLNYLGVYTRGPLLSYTPIYLPNECGVYGPPYPGILVSLYLGSLPSIVTGPPNVVEGTFSN